MPSQEELEIKLQVAESLRAQVQAENDVLRKQIVELTKEKEATQDKLDFATEAKLRAEETAQKIIAQVAAKSTDAKLAEARTREASAKAERERLEIEALAKAGLG